MDLGANKTFVSRQIRHRMLCYFVTPWRRKTKRPPVIVISRTRSFAIRQIVSTGHITTPLSIPVVPMNCDTNAEEADDNFEYITPIASAVEEPTPSSSSDDSCPICLEHYHEALVPLLQTPCGHSACKFCLERLLFAPPASAQVDGVVSTHHAIPLGVPTLGLCPMCRAPISLFELIIHKEGDSKAAYTKDRDIAICPIRGTMFTDRQGIGYGSFEFTETGDCYMDFSKVKLLLVRKMRTGMRRLGLLPEI
jgi:hypothetical protein